MVSSRLEKLVMMGTPRVATDVILLAKPNKAGHALPPAFTTPTRFAHKTRLPRASPNRCVADVSVVPVGMVVPVRAVVPVVLVPLATRPLVVALVFLPLLVLPISKTAELCGMVV